jgi:mannose-1-phosphate guanylyltransferase
MKTVILAAGFGSRLWPLSTSERPKQFLPLINGQSLLSYTYTQLAQTIASSDLYVLTLSGLEHHVQHELPDLRPDHLLLVPERRNTLPHTLFALSMLGSDPNEPILFKGVDHFIRNPVSFAASLQQSLVRYDAAHPILTLLCSPYINFNNNDGYCIVDDSAHVRMFLEKPTYDELVTAAGNDTIYRASFTYIASVRACLDALEGITEDWAARAQQLLMADGATRKKLFLDLPMLDISNALFKSAHQLVVDEIEYDFIDVGRFEEIYELNDKDTDGNVIIGKVTLGTACHDSLIINETADPLVVMALDTMVVAHSAAGSLVTPFNDASKIGDIYKSQIHKH